MYFESKLDEKYGEKFPEILEDNLAEASTRDYFKKYKLDEKYKEEYPEIINEQLSAATIAQIKSMGLVYKYKDIIYELKKLDIEKLTSEQYFDYDFHIYFGDKNENLLEKI